MQWSGKRIELYLFLHYILTESCLNLDIISKYLIEPFPNLQVPSGTARVEYPPSSVSVPMFFVNLIKSNNTEAVSLLHSKKQVSCFRARRLFQAFWVRWRGICSCDSGQKSRMWRTLGSAQRLSLCCTSSPGLSRDPFFPFYLTKPFNVETRTKVILESNTSPKGV